MEITWLGHSSLRLRSKGITLITDPYPDSVGFSMGRPEADVVTISNRHPHHSHCDGIEGHPRVLDGPGEYEIADLYISGTGTNLGEHDGERQVNTVFTIRVEGLTLCHLGDLNQKLSPVQAEELNQTDILFVPAGGVCTISAADAAQLVNVIGPRVVVPLHYWSEGTKVELGPLDPFLSEMGMAEIQPQARLSVTSSNLPRELSVVVLQRVV